MLLWHRVQGWPDVHVFYELLLQLSFDSNILVSRYKRKREQLVVRTAVARLPTDFGRFQAYSYVSKIDGIEHTAIVKGDIGDGLNVLVRVHSECLTGDIFASRRCDCGNQVRFLHGDRKPQTGTSDSMAVDIVQAANVATHIPLTLLAGGLSI
jgi:hypothetical protein